MDSPNKAQVSRMRLRNGRCKKSRNFMDWQTKPQVVHIISSTQAEPGRVGEVLKFPPHMKLPSFNSSSTWEMFFDMGPAISLEERVERLFNLFYEPFSPRQRSEKLLTQTEPDDSSGSIGEVGRRWLLKPRPPMTIPTVVSSSTWEIFFELGPAISFEARIEKLLELFLDPVSPQLRSTSTDSFPPSEHFDDEEVGTVVSLRNSEERVINSQVFVRDSIPSAFDFMMDGEPDTVRNCSLKTVCIQSWEKQVERFKLGEAVMLASFKVLRDQIRNLESMMADFGKNAVGRVVGFRTFSTLLCTDACCIIGHIMGVHGCPIEIQALFLVAMKSALPLLEQDLEGKMLVKRLDALILDLIDTKRLNDIHRLSTPAVNLLPDSNPEWIFDFMLARGGGYFIRNISPAGMNFEWFALGNIIANLTPKQSTVIIDLIESRWEELVGQMPLKVCNYPAIGSHEWQIITGCDRRNTSLRYLNGGSWPVLLWLLAAACIKNGQQRIARRAIELAETRLLRDNRPKLFIWKWARKLPTWSIARYLVAKMMLEDVLGMVSQDEDEHIKTPLRRSNSCWF